MLHTARTGDSAREGMTMQEFLGLPTSIDLDTANRAFGYTSAKGYDRVSGGTYPCRVLKVEGGAYRVVTADMYRALGFDYFRPALGTPRMTFARTV